MFYLAHNIQVFVLFGSIITTNNTGRFSTSEWKAPHPCFVEDWGQEELFLLPWRRGIARGAEI
jgi:hypothetical protein